MPIGSEATAPLSVSPGSSVGSEISVGDAVFCTHGRELCGECDADYREDNSLTFGVPYDETREPLTFEWAHDKNGEIVCKKHRSATCAHTAFKKAIQTANKAAKKAK